MQVASTQVAHQREQAVSTVGKKCLLTCAAAEPGFRWSGKALRKMQKCKNRWALSTAPQQCLNEAPAEASRAQSREDVALAATSAKRLRTKPAERLRTNLRTTKRTPTSSCARIACTATTA